MLTFLISRWVEQNILYRLVAAIPYICTNSWYLRAWSFDVLASFANIWMRFGFVCVNWRLSGNGFEPHRDAAQPSLYSAKEMHAEHHWRLLILAFILRETFKAYLLRDASTSLTFKNYTPCPHYVFSVYLRTNSDLCHLQHKLIGFYNRDVKCLCVLCLSQNKQRLVPLTS
jgi:hypothetical protein